MTKRSEKLTNGVETSRSFRHFEEIVKAVEDLRAEILFGDFVDGFAGSGISPMSEQHALLGLAELDAAMRHFRLAGYHLARGD